MTMNSTLDELDFGHVKDLVGNPENFGSKEELLEKIFQVFALCNLDHGCLQTNRKKQAAVTELWRFNSPDVTSVCQVLADEGKHPALLIAEDEQFPFDLFDFERKFTADADVEKLFSTLADNGLSHVYCIPVHSGGETYVFILARPDEIIDTVELLTFQSICANAVNKILHFEPRPCEAGRTLLLGKRERAALIGVARGETYSQIAEKFGFSELTVRSLIDASIAKLGGRNVSHTILLAIIGGEFGLIECMTIPDNVSAN